MNDGDGEPFDGIPKRKQGSYKETFTGSLPGAYVEAFSFKADMEEDACSNNEMNDLVEGVAVVRLSKCTKLCISGQSSNAIVIKFLGGLLVTIFFMISLWKPRGRMDYVDLEKEFFLIRFEKMEDYDRVLKGGFIGEHFLSNKVWEPSFRPSTTCVSSVVVWVRLPELPIEYYDNEILAKIESTIGPELRIDSNTAMEARGRFTRIYV